MNDSKQMIINISHNFNEKQYLKKSLEKFFVFSYAIEYMVFQKQLTDLADCLMQTLEESIIKCSKGKIRDKEWIGRWISELKFMGLIQHVDGEELRLKLTDLGEVNYRQQTFQTIYANLLSAKHNRILSIIATIIALLALIANIITWLIR